MIIKITQQDSNANRANEYFDALRQKNYEASFDEVKNFIREKKRQPGHRRRKKPLRKWQWMLAVLSPILVVIACTKTERTVPVGQTISFSVPVGDGAAIHALEPIVGGLQTIISPDSHRAGYLSYTTFIPAQSNQSVDVVMGGLQRLEVITGLSIVPLNTRVRESLLSRLGSKIFSTHVDATAMSDAEMQNTVNRQLKAQGFNHISVIVARNEKGIRTLQLQGGKVGPNYKIDVSRDDKGTKMVLQEETGGTHQKTNPTPEPQPDFSGMTDAQVRAYIQSRYGKGLRNEAIKIIRTTGEIAIRIKRSEKQEEILRFKLR